MLTLVVRDPGKMTSPSRLHPLTLLALLLVAHVASPAPTHTSSEGGATPQVTPPETSHTIAQRSWHLLLALWRPKEYVTPTGEVLSTGENLPSALVSPTVQVSPTREVITTSVGPPEGDVHAARGSPPGVLHPERGAAVPTSEELLAGQAHATRLYPPAGYVPGPSVSPSRVDDATQAADSDQHQGSSGTTQHPATQRDLTTPQHSPVDKLPHDHHSDDTKTITDEPEVEKQTDKLPAHSSRATGPLNTENSGEIYVPTTVKSSTDGGKEKQEITGEPQESFSEHKTDGVVGVVVPTAMSASPGELTTVTDSSDALEHVEVAHPALSGRQIVKHTSSEPSGEPPNAVPDEASTIEPPLPDGERSDDHFFMHPMTRLREPDHDAEEELREHTNVTSSSNTSQTQSSVEDSQQEPQQLSANEGDTQEDYPPHHSERGRKVLHFQGPVVMEPVDEPSLVPLVGPSKEILTLKDDEKAILALLRVAQGPNSLEDPFQVNSIIQNHDQMTSGSDQLSSTVISFFHDNDTRITPDDTQRLDHARFVDEGNDPRVLKKKDSKSFDSRKSVNALIIDDKDGVPAKDNIVVPDNNEGTISLTTAKPIYEEISDALKVDTSIDDVEDFDVQIKHTENTDDFLPTTNQSHPNFIDATLHTADHPQQELLADTDTSTTSETTTTTTTTPSPETTTSQHPTLPSSTSHTFSEHPTNSQPGSTTTTTAKTTTAGGDTASGDKWSVFVANIADLNSSLSLNESVFRKVTGMSMEEHYKMVLHERGSLMMQLMDPTADPCDDFYRFACGRWNGKFPVREDKAVDNTFERLKEDLDDVLRSLLEEPPLEADNNITRAVKILYTGCMNTEAIEALDARPLLDLLKELGGWPVLEGDSWNETGYEWVRQMARLRNYNNDILVSEWVAADITNSTNHIIQLDQPELGMPGREYFINPGDYQYREAYLNLMLSVTRLLGASLDIALRDMTSVLQFETQVSRILMAAEERRNLSAVHRRMTVEQLTYLVPEIDWAIYLDMITWQNNNTEEVVVYGLDYFRKLVPLLETTDNRTISNYLLWRFVKNRISNLGERYINMKQEYIKVLFGRKSQPERWRSCVTYVSGNLGYVVGAMFVKRYFPEASKNDTHEMISLIRDSFKGALNEARWMNEETRFVAQEKVDTIIKNVGYPEYLLNNTYMDTVYAELSFNPETHFRNVLKMLQFHARTNHNLLAVPVNRTAWVTSPAVVNAYYSRSKNMIVFPAGILQPPFYHPAFPRSLNYGGIGVVIGHEITHGFDDRGRQFDKNGNLQQWWTPDDVSKFYQRASCMLDQYGEYNVDDVGLKINPVNTLGENIADNAGIKIAYQAYQNWRKNNEETVTIPYVNFTHEQLFFLNFGQIWCEVNSPEAMLTKIRSGQHSPNRFRVIGTLSNSHEFSDAFSCPVGSRMNPERKCRVW